VYINTITITAENNARKKIKSFTQSDLGNVGIKISHVIQSNPEIVHIKKNTFNAA
jgi:hypothetical protein